MKILVRSTKFQTVKRKLTFYILLKQISTDLISNQTSCHFENWIMQEIKEEMNFPK